MRKMSMTVSKTVSKTKTSTQMEAVELSEGYRVSVIVNYYPNPGSETQKIEKIYCLDSETGDYENHIEEILKKFEIKGANPANYILEQTDKKNRRNYLIKKDLLEHTYEIEGNKVTICDQVYDAKTSLKRLSKICKWLKDPKNKGKTQMSDMVWFLNFEGRLKGEVFVEEFVDKGGMPMLMTILERSKKDNLTKLAVSCLYTACEYGPPLEYLRETKGAMERLYQLVYKESIKLNSAVMEFLFLMAADDEGHEFISNLILKVDKQQKKVPYARIIEFFTGKKGIELNENALVFCNVMLETAPDKKSREVFLKVMDEAGLGDAISTCDTTTELYLRNLDKFRALSGRLLNPKETQIAAMGQLYKNLKAHYELEYRKRVDYLRKDIPVQCLYHHIQTIKSQMRDIEKRNLIPPDIKDTREIKTMLSLCKDRHFVAQTQKKNFETKRSEAVIEYTKLLEKEKKLNEAIVKLKLDNASVHNKIGFLNIHVPKLRRVLQEVNMERIEQMRKEHKENVQKLERCQKEAAQLLQDFDSLNSQFIQLQSDHTQTIETRGKHMKELKDKKGKDKRMLVMLNVQKKLKALMKDLDSNPEKFICSKGEADGKTVVKVTLSGGKKNPENKHDDDSETLEILVPIQVEKVLKDPDLLKILEGETDFFGSIVDEDTAVGVVPPPPGGLIPPPPGGNIPPPPGLGAGVPPPPGGIPPPPGMGGGVPAPPSLGFPALPTLSASGSPISQPLVTKPKIKPKGKMKAVFWSRIVLPPSSCDHYDTIWRHIDTKIYVDEDLLVESFGRITKSKPKGAASPKQGKRSPTQGGRKKKKVIKALDSKVSRKIGVMLPRFPGVIGTRDAIVSLSDDFGEEKLEKLLKNLPEKESIQAIQDKAMELKAPPFQINFDKPEKFLIMLSDIPMLKQRLEAWMFKLQFKARYKLIEENLTGFQQTCEELMSSKVLPNIISAVLTVGNYLNGGTARGQADGFEVSFLQKVSSIKGNGITLLQFVAAKMKKQDPSILKIREAFPNLLNKSSSLPSITEMKAETDKLKSQFVKREKDAIKVAQEKLEGNDRFESVMKEFFTENEVKNTSLVRLMVRTKDSYKKVFQWFGTGNTEVKMMPSNEFLDIFRNFIVAFEKSFPKEAKKKSTRPLNFLRKKKKTGKKIAIKGEKGKGLDAVVNAIRMGGIKSTSPRGGRRKKKSSSIVSLDEIVAFRKKSQKKKESSMKVETESKVKEAKEKQDVISVIQEEKFSEIVTSLHAPTDEEEPDLPPPPREAPVEPV